MSRSFHPYFISIFSSKGRHLFYRLNFGANLNPFKIKLIRFENRIGRMCCWPHLSASRCLAPHPSTDDRGPVTSRPTCQPRRPRRPDPVALHCRARNAAAARAAAGPLPHAAVPRRYPRCAQSPPLFLPLSCSASTWCPPLRAPPPRRSPLKWSRRHRPNFLPRTTIFPSPL
jgi:hypothetical protein